MSASASMYAMMWRCRKKNFCQLLFSRKRHTRAFTSSDTQLEQGHSRFDTNTKCEKGSFEKPFLIRFKILTLFFQFWIDLMRKRRPRGVSKMNYGTFLMENISHSELLILTSVRLFWFLQNRNGHGGYFTELWSQWSLLCRRWQHFFRMRWQRMWIVSSSFERISDFDTREQLSPFFHSSIVYFDQFFETPAQRKRENPRSEKPSKLRGLA